MAVRYTLIYSDTSSIPDNSGATTFNIGENLPGGGIDEFIIRITTANTTNAILADFGNVMSSLRMILNGTTFFDFRSGYASASNNAPSQFGYFLNSLGRGRSVEVPGDTAKEVYYRIPCGRNVPAGTSRLEMTLTYAATAAAVASGTFEIYARYNSNMQTTTTVSASTSFTHSASEEQVIVRLPQGVPGVVAGVMVQNDTAADEIAVDGGLFLPLFGLAMDSDIRLQVNSSAATTRTYTPVIVASVNGAGEFVGTQTQAVVTNTATSVLDGTTESA